MRIAYVTETWPPELNGVSLTVERTVRFLRSRGHLVELIRPRQPGEARLDASDELRTAGCVIPMYPDLRFGLARAGTLARRFRQSSPTWCTWRRPGRCPGRRSLPPARSASPPPPISAPISTSTPGTTAWACSPGRRSA